jgi:hypothetical protein
VPAGQERSAKLRFELTVDVSGFTSEQTHTQVVSPAVLGQLQPGATVPCKVDPGDHSKLMLALAWRPGRTDIRTCGRG